MRKFYGRRMVFFPLIGIAALVLFPYVIMLLWQALGILVLSKILFGGFRGPFSHRHGNWHGNHNHMGPWSHRWMNMSEEERAKMKEEWQKRCRHHDHDEPESTKA
jgi:hypothetical protein